MANLDRNTPVVISAKRTPIGKFQGCFAKLSAVELGATAIRAAVAPLANGALEHVEEVLMGNVVSAGLGQAPARQASILAGIPVTVGATTLNKVCGSGLKAVSLAAQAIRAGDGGLFVAGGMESMTRAPYLMDGRNGEMRFGHVQARDSLLNDGLWDPFEKWGMGMAAEFIAREFGVGRAELDQYAWQSQQKAALAIESGYFIDEIAPVSVPAKGGQVELLAVDESPRKETTIETLAKLKPSFDPNGVVTAGNASTMNDGAAACLVASLQYAEKNGLQPLARIVASAHAAVPPKYLFDAPAHAIPKVLSRSGWNLADVDLIELNEAFAAQVLANGKALANHGWDWGKVNISGGAIALGHPLGASGTRILVTLIHNMVRTRVARGLACLCLGGGEAVALTVERM